MFIRIVDTAKQHPDSLLAEIEREESSSWPTSSNVETILHRVETEGDAAVNDFTARFDHVALSPDQFRVRDRDRGRHGIARPGFAASS